MTPVANMAPGARIAFAAALGAALAGCVSDNAATDKGPMATPQVVTVVEGVPQGPAATGASKTGFYPGFAQPLTSAALQMTDEEAVEQQRKLSALGAARARGSISQAEYKRREAEMRKLANSHGSEVLSEIEK